MKITKFIFLCISTTIILFNSPFDIRAQQSLELDNDTIHLKLDLTRGGAICYISKSGTTRNIVNIHDEGRYIQQSYYAGKSLNRQSEGQRPNWSPWPWNPIQVGDSYNNRAQILEYSQNGNSLYVKCIPMLWDMNNMPAEAEMEQWTTVEGNVIKVHNKLTCHRTDDIYGEDISNSQELPAVYPISALKNLYSYFGELPFSGGPLSNPPVVNLSSGFWGKYEGDMVSENWMAFVDDNHWGIGVYTPICSNFLAGMAGSPGFEATDGSTSYIAPVKTAVLNKNSVFEYDYCLVVGSLSQIRKEIYALKGIQANSWEFMDDMDGWKLTDQDADIELSEGSLKFTSFGTDSKLVKKFDSWIPENRHYLWLSIKNETNGDTGVFSFTTKEGDSIALYLPMVPQDDQYRNVFIDLDSIGSWSTDLILKSFCWDPLKNNEEGMVYLDFVRFMHEVLSLRTEGNTLTINDMNKKLQIYAEEIPNYSAVEVNWSVDDPEIASIDANGLLTPINDGVVTVTATARDGSGKKGSINIIIQDTGQKTAWEFTRDLQGWDKNPQDGILTFSDGALKFSVTGGDPFVNNNVAPWKVGDLKYLWIRIKNETASNNGAMYIFPSSGGFDLVMIPLTPNDSVYRDTYIDMRSAKAWTRYQILDKIRLDPNNDGSPGDIYVDFIRFLKDLVKVWSEGNVSNLQGFGNTLQIYAQIMAGDGGTDVTWKVNNPEIATIDQEGLLTAVAAGKVLVTATSKLSKEIMGTIEITITADKTGISHSLTDKLEIYPNPATQAIYLINAQNIHNITIFTQTGKVIRQLNASQLNAPINIISLFKGVYFIKANLDDGNIIYSRFIKD